MIRRSAVPQSPARNREIPKSTASTLAILVAALIGSLAFAGVASAQITSIPGNYLSVPDQDGANDQPSQVDLTRFGRDDSDDDVYKLLWSWDSTTDWTGSGQTGDACALFDSDGDGNVNFVVCARVENPGADVTRVAHVSPSPYLFNC